MTSASDEKWRHFNCFLAQITGGSQTGPDLANRMCGQDIGSPGISVSCGLQVPVKQVHCRAICCNNLTLPYIRDSNRLSLHYDFPLHSGNKT